MPPQLAAQIKAVTEALPPAHCVEPQDDEEVNSIEDGFRRLQDWAFTQGFAIVKESLKKRMRITQTFHCAHHGDKPRNTRKLTEEDRKRKNTKVLHKGCKWSIKISRLAENEQDH